MSIDWSMGDGSNVDSKTGIRFGVIQANTIGRLWNDLAESEYGEPTCPQCGNVVVTFDAVEGDMEEYSSYNETSPLPSKYYFDEYACETCNLTFSSDDAFPEEPIRQKYEDDGYLAVSDHDNVYVTLLKSPYYTMSQFCSPCFPGAGNMDTHDPDGPKTYCFGLDWWDDSEYGNGPCPYPIYVVDTDECVYTPSEEEE